MSNALSTMVQNSWEWLFYAHEQPHGISSFNDKKFYLVLVLYLSAFMVFAHDPFFLQHGAFVYQQGIVTLLLAAVLAASLNWELCLFGKPVGANLLLQVIQMFPIALFIARISAQATAVKEEKSSYIGQAMDIVKEWLDEGLSDLWSWIPDWVTDMFLNWKICLLMALILFSLCFRRVSIKIAGVCFCLCITLMNTVVNGGVRYLFLGMVLLGAGMTLQFCRYDRIVYFENVFHHLQRAQNLDQLFAAAALRIMTELQNSPRLSENNLLGLIRSEYDPEGQLAPDDIRLISSEVMRKLIYEFDLITMHGDADGVFFSANFMLRFNDSILTQIATFPRVTLALLMAAVWVLMPVDLIPDSVPFLGMLDDVTVSIFSGLVLKNSLENYAQHR